MSALRHVGTLASAGASAADSSRWRRLTKNTVTITVAAGLGDGDQARHDELRGARVEHQRQQRDLRDGQPRRALDHSGGEADGEISEDDRQSGARAGREAGVPVTLRQARSPAT